MGEGRMGEEIRGGSEDEHGEADLVGQQVIGEVFEEGGMVNFKPRKAVPSPPLLPLGGPTGEEDPGRQSTAEIEFFKGNGGNRGDLLPGGDLGGCRSTTVAELTIGRVSTVLEGKDLQG